VPVSKLFEVVAEPHRRRMLDLLRSRDRSVGELVDELDLAQPTVSKHLKALRAAGLVIVRPEAQRRWYQLRPDPLRELDVWLAPYRRAWADRLDALETHLEEMEDE
jgi:DNA-binding transcriptional ArsR family regulator